MEEPVLPKQKNKEGNLLRPETRISKEVCFRAKLSAFMRLG